MSRTNDRFAFCLMLLEKQRSKLRLAVCFSALALAFGAQQMRAATVTYIVGTCMSGKTFTSIQSALDAIPAPDTVEVCPGSYQEQILITKPVTLEGIASGSADKAIILPPTGGLIVNTSHAAAQLLVLGPTDVTIQNLTINGTGNHVSSSSDLVVGILYENASGTINGVHLEDQESSEKDGVAILLEGGSSKPAVTVENCFLQDFDNTGIFGAYSTTSEMSVTVKNNFITVKSGTPATQGIIGLSFDIGSTVTISGNYINGSDKTAIGLGGATGTISGNTIVTSGGYGVYVSGQDAAISFNSNYVFVGGGSGYGVYMQIPTSLTKVQDNTIVFAQDAIELNCLSTSGNINSNTILYAEVGVDQLHSGASSSNTYYDVATQTTTCP